MTFPDDATLLARGKYATLGSMKRAEMKRLHEYMSTITDQARVIVRYDEEPGTMMSFYEALQERVSKAGECLETLVSLQSELDELKPAAWPEREKK